MKPLIYIPSIFRRIGICLLLCSIFASPAFSAETIKVGVLHSLSGTMAISETTLKDTMLMMIEEQNKAGGLLLSLIHI